jgi:hypothetical protein
MKRSKDTHSYTECVKILVGLRSPVNKIRMLKSS